MYLTCSCLAIFLLGTNYYAEAILRYFNSQHYLNTVFHYFVLQTDTYLVRARQSVDSCTPIVIQHSHRSFPVPSEPKARSLL